jgi:hypothetical protein
LSSLIEIKAISITKETWFKDAKENIRNLRRTIGQQIKATEHKDEELMWKEIDQLVQNIEVEDLEFNHPMCSGVLDITSSPIKSGPRKIHIKVTCKFA